MKSLARGRHHQAPANTPAAAHERTPGGYHQSELRDRRRKWLPHVYRGNNFDLSGEVDAIVRPLARQIATLPRPLSMRPKVDDVADAVHEVVSTVVGLLAESNLSAPDARARAIHAVRDLAQRPTAPEITDEQIAAGTWAGVLVDYAAPLAADLSAVLDRAAPPGAIVHSASERLEAALRVLDTSARDAACQIPKLARYQSLPTVEEYNASKRREREAARIRKSLAKFGIEEPE